MKRAFRWLDAVWEFFQRDSIIKVDELCTDLRTLGVGAQVTKGDPTGKGFLRVIAITQSPISWVKLTGQGSGDFFEWVIECWIYDSRHLPRMKIRAFDLGLSVRWEGEYEDSGIEQCLSDDREITNAILQTGDFMTIQTSPKNGYWVILDPLTPTWWHRPIVKQEQWDCYENIANHLLTTPIPVKPS